MQKGFYAYSGETWTPNVNLYETNTSYLVCVDLAGVDKRKIDVEVADQRLKLRGNRAVPQHQSVAGAATNDDEEDGAPDEVGEGGAGDAPAAPEASPPGADAPGIAAQRRVRIHLMEIDHGAFSREVELPPDVNKERIAARYRNGMLWIEIPKT